MVQMVQLQRKVLYIPEVLVASNKIFKPEPQAEGAAQKSTEKLKSGRHADMPATFVLSL